MSFAHGKRLRLRLFLEGVEVPVISANVRSAPSSPTMCSLQVPPLAEGTRLLPRTLVHLFFLDDADISLPNGSSASKSALPTRLSPTAQQAENDSLDGFITGAAAGLGVESANDAGENIPLGSSITKYKVLFAGEVAGFTWSKNASSRSLILQCFDFSNYWDYAYQYRGGLFGPGRKAIFSGGGTTLFDDFLSSKGQIITQIVSSGRCNSFPKMRGLAAGVIRLIEAISGIYYPSPELKGKGRVGGQNIFFSLAELRLKLTHMVSAFPTDPTSAKILRRQGWSGMFNRRLGGLGGQVSIRKAISSLSQLIFYEMYGQPCPYFEPGTIVPPGSKRVRLSRDPRFRRLGSIAEKWAKAFEQLAKLLEDIESGKVDMGTATGRRRAKRISGTVEEPGAPTAEELRQGQSIAAVAANQSGGDQSNVVSRGTTLEETLTPPNVNLVAGGVTVFRTRVTNALRAARGELNTVHSLASSTGAPPQAAGLLSTALQKIGTTQTTAHAWRPTKFTPSTLVFELKAIADILRKLSGTRSSRPTKSYAVPARMHVQIYRPDIWFGSPPRCNVLFPEDYDSLSYERQFMQEPSRLLFKTNDEFFGEDFLFDRFYVAPQTGSLKRDKGRLRTLLRQDLLEHELFTGILPIFEKSGEFNVFASKSRGGKSEKYKAGYAQRSANFMYMKYRFNARRMSIRGKFNPYIACGFPGVILDRYLDTGVIKLYNELKLDLNKARSKAGEHALPRQAIAESLGTNFLGAFTEVTHSVSNQGTGTTEIRCSYPRQAEETVEFLGTRPATVVRRKVGEPTVRTTDVASIFPPRIAARGPNGGRITGVYEVTKKYIDLGLLNPAGTGEALPLYVAKSRKASNNVATLVPIGHPVSARDLGIIGAPGMLSITDDPDRPIVFKAYSIDEEVDRYRREEVAEPLEDLIQPGWYDDLWRPSRIGEAYQSFFGIGSINDPHVIKTDVVEPGRAEPEGSALADVDALLAEGKDDPRAGAPVINALVKGSSIQDAIEFLVLTYSYIRQNNLDVDEFISSYTFRPIATMADIFGTTDLKFSDDGHKVIQGTEGIHSRAFGPYDDLHGIITKDLGDIIGLKKDSLVGQRGDTRKRKQDAVIKYVSVLAFSRGVLG